MPPTDREASRERGLVVKHQHSWSDSGRSSVPMWDSSDPDRAPPPLPLNPSAIGASPTRTTTSATVAAAAQALADRARESLGPSPYTTNPRPLSPEKSPVKTPQNKRLQSLQTGNTKDFKNYFENGRSPSPERNNSLSATPVSARDWLSSSPERSITPTPTTNSKDLVKSGRGIRRSMSRPEMRPILGENTPPSSTVLAMKNMAVRDFELPLSNITNSSTTRTPQSYDGIYHQIANLTSIATKLQSEMTALSRRSKDNATDLIALKNATSCRDEDIRKSLRELVNGVRASEVGLLAAPPPTTPRAISALGKGAQTPERPQSSPTITKTVSLPRILPFQIGEGEDTIGRQSSQIMESPAGVAMLEKILREMATKEGQEHMLATLPRLLEKSGKDSLETKTKVEELLSLIRERQTTQALVRHKGPGFFSQGADPMAADFDFGPPPPLGLSLSSRETGPSPLTSSRESQKNIANAVVNEELLKLLQKIKDSVAHSGGITGEVKSLVRDLRGEVLGMGRELGRKVDNQLTSKPQNALIKHGMDQEELVQIMQDSLAELREHMDQVIQSKRRLSSGSTSSRNTVDSQEVFQVVKHALAARGLDKTQPLQNGGAGIDREAIFAAVKEAYEEYKPEIEIQHIGLSRDEILECLREGLEDYRESNSSGSKPQLGKDEIMSAMRQAMQSFQPPMPVTEASEIKAEVLSAVRECLNEFNPPQTNPWQQDSSAKFEIIDAVKETLADHKKEGTREIEISRDDLFDAVQAGLNNNKTPFGGYGDKVLHSLHEIVEGMQVEFRQYSAANGRDTEQVLDALKDGLEALRSQVEMYVDRAQDVTGKDEILESLRSGLESLRSSFEDVATRIPAKESSRSLESQHKDDLMMAISAGFVSVKAALGIRNRNGEPADETLEAVKEEFNQLRALILNGSSSNKDEILESMQDSFKNMHAKIDSRDMDGTREEGVINALKVEFNALHETLAASLSGPQSQRDRDAIIETVQESLEGIRNQLAANQGELTNGSLGAIKDELEQLRQIVGSAGSVDKDEIMEAIRTGLETASFSIDRGVSSSVGNPDLLETVRAEIEQLKISLDESNGDRGIGNNGINDALEALRGELEHLRQSLAATLIKNGARVDTEEVVDTVRLGLDDLRSHFERKLDNPDRFNAATGEMLDAFNEGLDGLRVDIAKAVDKQPAVDMTLSYEILDALKDGLSGVRADIAELKSERKSLKNGEVILADSSIPTNRSVSDSEDLSSALKKNDLDKLEVMLAHLQIKVEAMDQNIQSAPPAPNAAEATAGVLRKEDLANIVVMLTDLQGTVADLVSREHSSDHLGHLASKEDTDAIETLLQNTKAKIDDRLIPGIEAAVTKDDLDAVEAVVRLTNESIDELSSRVDGKAASKEDIASIEVMLQDATATLDDLRTKFTASDTSTEKVTKSDVDIVEGICSEIKERLGELPDSEDLPSKADFEHLAGLLEDLSHNHKKFRDRYENDIGVTAKAFDDRKEDTSAITDQLAELKTLVESSKDELKTRLKRGTQDVRALDEILQSIEDKIEELPNAVEDVQSLRDLVQEELSRAYNAVESLKIDQEQQNAEVLSKHDEIRASIVCDFADKLDDRVSALMARHDEHQQASELAANAMAERADQQNEVLASSKTMTEDLKITIDTLGASITTIAPVLAEATDRMSDDAKTVFNRVDDMSNKLDVNHEDNKVEHQLTRTELARLFSSMSGLQEEITGFHPQFTQALKEVLLVVAEHYDHSKTSQESSREQVEDIKNSFLSFSSNVRDINAPMLTAPPSNLDDSKIHTKLDKVLEHLDQSTTHAKLDDLLNHSVTNQSAGPELEQMDSLQEQITSIATEISAFVAFQTKMITADHENKERDANQAAMDLSKCLHEKEELEFGVNNLTEKKTKLEAEVEAFKAERDGLMAQKLRLTADVSSLETALRIRTEELHAMDARADALERRIIEGVMDHSRALLLTKGPKSASNLNLKRVPSNMSNSTSTTTVPSSAVSTGIGMALKSKSAVPRSTSAANPAARRILSLGQMSANRAAGGHTLATTPSGGLGNLKRSHTVKTRGVQKGSWPARRTVSDFDKENEILSEESDHGENEPISQHSSDLAVLTRSTPYDSGSVFEAMTPVTDRRFSNGTAPSEYTYGTGSSFTGTDLSRRSSYASIVRSNIATLDVPEELQQDENESSQNPSENDFETEPLQIEYNEDRETDLQFPDGNEEQQQQIRGNTIEDQVKHELVLYERDRHHESDSGLGTDLPTAPLSHTLGSDLFQVPEERF